tara:strand:+ start:127 stop:750 length:624 start_codon:yes stop_codon:yes gene_type:complete
VTKQTQNTALENKVLELIKSSANTTKTIDSNNSLILDAATLLAVIINKQFPNGASKEQKETINKVHLSKLNKNTMKKVSSLANNKKFITAVSESGSEDLETVKKAVEKATGEKSLAKIKKACAEPKEKTEPISTKKVSVIIPDEMKTVITDIQFFISLTPENQYKVRQFMFNLPIDKKNKDNVIPAEFLADVIALTPQILTPALIDA